MQFVGGPATIGPAWTRGEMERPAGEKSMGTWTAAVYTPEQQQRLGVDEMGNQQPAAGGGGGGDGGGGGVWEGAEALAQQREMAARWQQERAAAAGAGLSRQTSATERAAAAEARRAEEAANRSIAADSAELARVESEIEALSEPGTAAPAPAPARSYASDFSAGRQARAERLAARQAEGGRGRGGGGGGGGARGGGGGGGTSGGGGGGSSGEARFPAHWGEPPAMQTRDIRPLPGGFGMGSGTLARWIEQKMAEDAAGGGVGGLPPPKPGPPAGSAATATPAPLPTGRERREATAQRGRTRRAALLAAQRETAAAGGRFPAHWGEPPRMQTKDLRQLPGGYGMGSGTLVRWIEQKMAEDASA